MIHTFAILFLVSAAPGMDATTAQNIQAADSTEVIVQKDIIYKKETSVDLTGSVVEGENQLPPAFFLEKMQTPKAQGLLAERLRFSLRHYNDLGF